MLVVVGSVLTDDTVATPASVPEADGVALTVTVALAPLARLPRSQANAVPVPHVPWLGVTLLRIKEESRFRANAAPCAGFGPLLLIVATHEMAVPVLAVAGAVSVTERSAGDADRSCTSGDWKMKI